MVKFGRAAACMAASLSTTAMFYSRSANGFSGVGRLINNSNTRVVSRSLLTSTHRGGSNIVMDHVLPSSFLKTTTIATNNNSRTSGSSRTATTTGLNMIFGSLFGGGGAYFSKIDYDELDYPGPELGKMAKEGTVPVVTATTEDKSQPLHIATFAGGCFWGLELAYQRVPGVICTAVGYTQGKEIEPNYDQVCSGGTGHTEAVIVYYNPNEVTYEDLLDVFFIRVDPTTQNGQGRDYGKQYRTGVYYHSPEQQSIANKRFEQEKGKYPKRFIATELKAAMPFWPAEKYHQQYLEKGGRFGSPQSAKKGATEEIRCYG